MNINGQRGRCSLCACRVCAQPNSHLSASVGSEGQEALYTEEDALMTVHETIHSERDDTCPATKPQTPEQTQTMSSNTASLELTRLNVLFLLDERTLEKLRREQVCSEMVRATSLHSGVGNYLLTRISLFKTSAVYTHTHTP